MLVIIGIILLLVGVGLVVSFWRPTHRLYFVRRSSRSTIGGALEKVRASGRARVQLHGTAEAPEPLRAPGTLLPCLYFRHKIEERVDVTLTVDGVLYKGESWAEVADESMRVPFALRDDTGSIDVDPSGARFIPKLALDGVEGAPGYRPEERGADAAADSVIRAMANARGKGVYRTFEWLIPLGQEAYVLGTARKTEGDALIRRRGGGPLIIGWEPEEWLVDDLRAKALVWALGCLMTAAGVAVGILGIL